MLKIKRSELKQLAQNKFGNDSIESQNKILIMISTAMAARTSYTVVGEEKEFGYDKQIELHDRMAKAVPFHASPFEHCARAMSNEEYYSFYRGKIEDDTDYGWCRNFKGFIQYRHMLEK